MRPLRRLASLPALLLAAFAAAAQAAAPLPAPAGKVILSIAGNIAVRNAGEAAEFDRAMLEALPRVTVRTATPWTDGVIAFEGVSFPALLARVGAGGTHLTAVALNDYSIEIEIADLVRSDAFLAFRMDGKPMAVRDKGPLWIIYPVRDGQPPSPEQTHRMVWQLRRLVVR